MIPIAQCPTAYFKGFPLKLETYDKDKIIRKKNIVEFLNSDRREIEDLGDTKGIFSLNVSVTLDTQDSYMRFDNMLKEKGAGTLILPYHGIIIAECVKATGNFDYLKGHGIAKYSLDFVEVNPIQILPVKVSGLGFLDKLTGGLFNKLSDYVNTGLNAVNNAKRLFDATNNTLRGISIAIDGVTARIHGNTSVFSDFVSAIRDIKTSSEELIQSTDLLGDRLKGAYEFLRYTFNDKKDVAKLSYILYNTGYSDTSIIGKSKTSRNIDTNQIVLNNSFKIYAVTVLSESIAKAIYVTSDEVITYKKLIVEVYNNLPEDLPREISNDLQLLRTEVLNILKNLQLTLPKLVQINGKGLSLTNILYNYYGNLGNYDTIRTLNSLSNTAYINGTIYLLSA